MTNSVLRERWQPIRSGLLNLFKFEDQVFRFENGRLLLRGDNGSGKSRVLALQLPFLLDGELSPHRVEPDRDPAKRMEWHLLMDRYEQRTGYTWIEFGRLEDGEPRYLTLGCGLEAQKGGGSPRRWFFISPRRVGRDFQLAKNRVPLGRRQLAAEFEERGLGSIYEKAGEYRVAVDDALFKLGSRYSPLIDLLIQLRQPQLMREMKEDVLSAALSEALPPVGEALIEEVAESFQGLDSDRRRYDDHREMLESVETFRDGYRQYLAVAIRRLCKVVRIGHSQFEGASRDLRALDGQSEENTAAQTAARAEAADLEARRTAVEEEIATLRDSPEMRSRRELEEAVRRAGECRSEAGAAQTEWERAERSRQSAAAEREDSSRRCRERRGEVETGHARLAEAHGIIAMPGAEWFDWETAELAAERSRAGELVDVRRRSIVHLRQRNEEVAGRRSRLDRERERFDERRSAVAAAEEKVRESGIRLDEETEAFGEAVARWEASIVELHADAFPRGHDWAAALSGWVGDRVGDPPLAGRLVAGRDHVHRELAEVRRDLTSRRERLEAEGAEVGGELARLREGRQPEPPARPARAPRPPGRPGAPFWRWCEFRDEIPDDERSGWEAALESAGLLDAWVCPDGRLDAEAADDDFLAVARGDELALEKSLAVILRPEAGCEAIAGLLRRVGNHREAAGCWVARDGHWANGPHFGSWHKPASEYLGHRAREAARLRRIAALEAQFREVTGQLEQLAARESELDGRAVRLDAECRAAPPSRPVEELAIALEAERDALQGHKAHMIEAEGRMTEAEHHLHEAIARRDADAADMGLAAWAEPEKLDEFVAAVDDFDRRAIPLWSAWERYLDTVEDHRRATEREARAIEDEERLLRWRDEKRDRAERARVHAQTMREAVGATVEQLLERLHTAEAAAGAARRDHDAVLERIRRLELDAARLDEKRDTAHEKRESAEASRNRAVGRMEGFVAERLFAELDPDWQPDRATFSATAAVELARRLEHELKDHPEDDEHWNSFQSEITGAFNELTDQLGRHGMVPRLRVIDESSVSVIDCEFQSRPRTVRELSVVLAEELANRERIFQEHEREVIENHLIGEAAIELQRLIRSGEESVTRINEELSRVPTSSGILLKFAWEVADPGDDDLRAVRRLFLKTSATWTLAERDAVGRFLQQRIQAARDEDDTVTWREHLARALDYRSWHCFHILRRRSGEDGWKKLTKRTFGTGSGGEKALTLTVPQFAAAAAHYRSASPIAPRLILLDEVFVAIDAPTRARLMELLETFDLDYVMTSEREWGVYATVSALAIYHLASRPGYNAIAVTRWVWNGRDRLRDETRTDESSASIGERHE